MSTATKKPTILMVHGSWHNPSHFRRLRDLCEGAGYPTSCPLHPSVGALPPTGLREDAQCIRDELTKLVDGEGRDVIVIAHSYGGIVATEAVDAAFAKAERQRLGKPGGVVHLLYMTAFLVQPGESLGAALGNAEALPPFIPTDERGMCMMLEPARRFYNDLPEDEQELWVTELKECPAIAQLTPVSQAAYMFHPSTYLFCEGDQGLPPEVQHMMVDKVVANTGVALSTESCTAGHSPFLSQPQTVLNIIQKLAA